jgi:hypothetical protein
MRIQNEEDYNAVLDEIDSLMDAEYDTPEGIRLNNLVTLVMEYEDNMETEKCVMCGGDTKVARQSYVDERAFYVEGAGQLCRDCWYITYEMEKQSFLRPLDK